MCKVRYFEEVCVNVPVIFAFQVTVLQPNSIRFEHSRKCSCRIFAQRFQRRVLKVPCKSFKVPCKSFKLPCNL